MDSPLCKRQIRLSYDWKTMQRVLTLLLALMLCAACDLSSFSGEDTSAQVPATVTEPTLSTALEQANTADQTARSALNDYNQACPPGPAGNTADHLCTEGTLLPLKAVLEEEQTECDQTRQNYQGLASRKWEGRFVGQYPGILDREYQNPLTKLPFTCGRPQ